MPKVRLYAAARASAGVASVDLDATTLRDMVAELSARLGPDFARVLSASSLLVNGHKRDSADATHQLVSSDVVDVLPPFAGG